jgi:CRISPR-associated exonuclease Cas4
MLPLAIFLLALALFLLWQARRSQHSLGLPAGRIIYTDTGGWGRVEEPIYHPELHLVGRPDYLVEKGGQVIPVEVKSSRVGSAPYDAHIFQLAAYCALVDYQYGQRPAYGILHYPNRTYAIDYTPELETALLELLEEMQQTKRSKTAGPPRSHDSPARCHACGYRNICDQRL